MSNGRSKDIKYPHKISAISSFMWHQTSTLCTMCERSAVQLDELCRLFPVHCSMVSLLSLTVSLTRVTQQQLACSSRELADAFRQGDWCYSHLEQNKTSLISWHPPKNPHCEPQQAVRCVLVCQVHRHNPN